MPDDLDEILGRYKKKAPSTPPPTPSPTVPDSKAPTPPDELDQILQRGREAHPPPPPASRGGDPLRDLVSKIPSEATQYGKGLAQGLGENVASFPYPGKRFLGATLGRTEPGKAVSEFLNQSWGSETLPQIVGRVSGLALPYGRGLGAPLEAGKNIAAWEAAHYVTHALGIPGGYHAAYVLFHVFNRVPRALKAIVNDLRGGGGKVGQELAEDLKAAKAGGTVIPKATESAGTKAAKTQAKFTPKAAEGISSGDVAAAKLAKMTGAVHPGEESLVKELAKRDLQATSKVPPARAPAKGSRPETAAEFKARLRGQPGVRTGVKEPEED